MMQAKDGDRVVKERALKGGERVGIGGAGGVEPVFLTGKDLRKIKARGGEQIILEVDEIGLAAITIGVMDSYITVAKHPRSVALDPVIST